MDNKQHFRLFRYITVLVCLLLLPSGLETAEGAPAEKIMEKRPEMEKIRNLSPEQRLLEKKFEKLDRQKEQQNQIDKATQRFKETNQLSDTGLKLHSKPESLSVVDRRTTIEPDVYEPDVYEIARQSREWAEARRIYESLLKNKHTDKSLTMIAKDRLRCIADHEAVDQMPPNSLVLEVLPSGGFHLAINNPDLRNEKETFKNLSEIRELQQKLQHAKRILIGPEARQSGLADSEISKAFPGKVLWWDSKLDESAKTVNKRFQETTSLKELATVVLFPRDAEQQELVGLNWSQSVRDRAWAGVDNFLRESGISDIFETPRNRSTLLGWFSKKSEQKPLKEELVETIQKEKDVLIFFSHGDREGVYLPDQKGNKLTAEEVSKLDLSKNKPLVLLFSCEAIKPAGSSHSPFFRKKYVDPSTASISIAEALNKAGATVFAFPYKVEAGESTIDALRFIEDVKKGKTLGDALEQLYLRIRENRPDPMLKVQIEIEILQQLNSFA